MSHFEEKNNSSYRILETNTLLKGLYRVLREKNITLHQSDSELNVAT